jgi:hypothetical protein
MDPLDFYRFIAEVYNRPINDNPSIFEVMLTAYALDHHSWQGLRHASIFFEEQAALIEQQSATIAQLEQRLGAVEVALGITAPPPAV